MKKSFVTHIIHIIKKLTVIDWIVGILLLGVVGFFLISRTTKTQRWVTVTLRVAGDQWYYNLAPPEYWYANDLAKGQVAYDSFGKKTAEILSVENYDIGGPNRLIIVHLKLLTTFNKTLKTYTFNYQTLQIGNPLDLTFGTNNLHGLVTYIDSPSLPYTMTNIEVKLLAVYPWEATSYQTGLQMKDFEGNTVATIRNVEIQDSQVTQLQDQYGNLVAIPSLNSLYKDVTLRLTLKTVLVHSVPFYIDGSAIKIGNLIWIEFEHTALKKAIISNIY